MNINLYNTHTVSVVCGCGGAFIRDKNKVLFKSHFVDSGCSKDLYEPFQSSCKQRGRRGGGGGGGCSFVLDKWEQTAEGHKVDQESLLIWWTGRFLVEKIGRSLKTKKKKSIEKVKDIAVQLAP